MTSRAFAASLPLLALGVALPFVPLSAAPAGESAMPHAATPAHDPLFREPYVDIDEWRDAPVRHHYIHGGFKGTEVLLRGRAPEAVLVPAAGVHQGAAPVSRA